MLALNKDRLCKRKREANFSHVLKFNYKLFALPDSQYCFDPVNTDKARRAKRL